MRHQIAVTFETDNSPSLAAWRELTTAIYAQLETLSDDFKTPYRDASVDYIANLPDSRAYQAKPDRAEILEALGNLVYLIQHDEIDRAKKFAEWSLELLRELEGWKHD